MPEVPGLKLGTLIEGDDGVVVFLRLEEFEVEARLVGATGDAEGAEPLHHRESVVRMLKCAGAFQECSMRFWKWLRCS